MKDSKTMVVIQVRMPKELLNDIQAKADQAGRSRNNFIVTSLGNYLIQEAAKKAAPAPESFL